MASGNFDRCFDLTIKYEGGYVDHPRDPGGATNLGVTIGTLSAWLGRPATKVDVRALNKARVKPIYEKNYWKKVNGDSLPAGADLAVYDYGVNSGPARANKTFMQAKTAGDGKAVAQKVCAIRRSFLRSLKTFSTFGKGWLSRVAHVEATAVAWALAATGKAPDQVKAELKAEAAKAETEKRSSATKAGAAGAAGASAPAIPVESVSPDLAPYAIAAVLLALIIAAVIYAHRSSAHAERARAFAGVANA